MNSDGLREVPGLQILGRTDPVGAGDSMLAGIAAAGVEAARLGRSVLRTETAGPVAVALVRLGLRDW